MTIPNIIYYAKMEFNTSSKKTPKYTIKAQAGYYPSMEELKDKNGVISMYLLEKLKDGTNVPYMRLQAKNSLNFTGLKDYFVNGELSGFAYGYPFASKTYSSKNKPNPFYEYKDDGFLFIMHQDETLADKVKKIMPDCIELIVLQSAKVLISAYCKQLIIGGFNEAIKSLREQAK